jgi:molybdenum cofactor cytidylyltransferase
MGAPKQLAVVGGRPMLLAVIEPLLASRVAGVVVVTHSLIAERLGALLGPPADAPGRIQLVLNDDESSEMIDSVRLGLRSCHDYDAAYGAAGFLVCPGDQPGIHAADFDACIAAFERKPDPIVIATHAGRRGHPLIFPAGDAGFVQSAACDAGLNALPRAFPRRVLAVECGSGAVVQDVDTPEDLAQGRMSEG